MKFDYSKLDGRITEKFGSRKAFAEALGVSENTISRKFNGKAKITTSDIEKWSLPEFLDINPGKIGLYFFTSRVQEVEQKGK